MKLAIPALLFALANALPLRQAAAQQDDATTTTVTTDDYEGYGSSEHLPEEGTTTFSNETTSIVTTVSTSDDEATTIVTTITTIEEELLPDSTSLDEDDDQGSASADDGTSVVYLANSDDDQYILPAFHAMKFSTPSLLSAVALASIVCSLQQLQIAAEFDSTDGSEYLPDYDSLAESSSYSGSDEAFPYFDDECTDVSVEGDATYCIQGAICSGDGELPAGDRCPQVGDVAVADCHDDLPSFANGECVAAKDAVCLKIHTGAWGCVWDAEASVATPAATNTSDAEATAHAAETTTGIAPDASVGSGLAATIAVVAGVAATMAAVAGVWLRSKGRSQNHLESPTHSLETVVTPPSSARAVFHRV
ncbi:hypothetical protein BBJ28_00012049 [Nothophytophthora sp. Chile5]|nr:hypothetical protein BBJ28_00012049 [Nothophytophthora sp. Chile5]